MTVWTKIICRLLVALMVWTPWQITQAGMIGAGDSVAAAAASSLTDRAAVLGFINRADIARELQSLGIEPALAAERVDAMTDQELRSIADRVRDQPAGAEAAGILAWIIIIWAIWYFFFRKKPA